MSLPIYSPTNLSLSPQWYLVCRWLLTRPFASQLAFKFSINNSCWTLCRPSKRKDLTNTGASASSMPKNDTLSVLQHATPRSLELTQHAKIEDLNVFDLSFFCPLQSSSPSSLGNEVLNVKGLIRHVPTDCANFVQTLNWKVDKGFPT